MSNNEDKPIPDDRSLRIQKIAEQRSAFTLVLTEYDSLRAEILAENMGFESIADVGRFALGKLLDDHDAANNNVLANQANIRLIEEAEKEEEILRQNPDLPRL